MTTKERFQQTDNAKLLFELAAEPWFQNALEVALVQYAKTMLPQGEPYGDAANHNRMEGAKRYIAELLDLAVKPQPQVSPFQNANLRRE